MAERRKENCACKCPKDDCSLCYKQFIDCLIHIVDPHSMEWKWRTCLLHQVQWLVTATKHKEQIVVDAKAATRLSARNDVLPGVILWSDYI